MTTPYKRTNPPAPTPAQLKWWRTIIANIVVSIVFGATVPPASAAHDYSNDLFCQITDNSGKSNYYAFANNSHNADGTLGGTFVETGYTSSDGKSVAKPAGSRPIWAFYGESHGGLHIVARDTPGWEIFTYDGHLINGVWRGPAVLFHGEHGAGKGECARVDHPTAGTIGDVSPE